MKLDIIIFMAVCIVFFMINIWLGILILLFNILAILSYINNNYNILWKSYFKIHILMGTSYIFGRFFGLIIMLLLDD